MTTGLALIDTCVLIDLVNDNAWAPWATAVIRSWRGGFAINAIIFSEFAVGISSLEVCEAALPRSCYQRLDLPWEAAFLAGQAQRRYRQDGGTRERTLPDFLIGAHAAVAGLALITRDPRRYRRHYPRLQVIAPDTHFKDLAPQD